MDRRRFRITLLHSRPTMVPLDRFSVRKTSVVSWRGRYCMYADVIPWDSPYHPDSYGTSVHLFLSDDAERWSYEGEVIPKGIGGSWTAAGVATPGAVVFGDRILVAFSVRGRADGSGHRFIGVAAADHPRGPFEEIPRLRIAPEEHDYSLEHPTLLLDDPCLVATNLEGTGPGDERLDIYYRHSLFDFREGRELLYTIALKRADGGEVWGSERRLLTGKKLETADARWVEGRVVMTVLAYSEGEMAVYVSEDGEHFEPAEPYLLESYLDIFMPAACFRLPGFIQDAGGRIRYMTTPGDIDDHGHYTQFVFRVKCS